MTARPSVHLSSSAGVASLRSVGFERGKIIGRRTWRAISRTILSVKVFGWPDVPIKAVGFALLITSAKLIPAGFSSFQSLEAIAPLGKRHLERLQCRHSLDQQSVSVDEIESTYGFRLAQTRIDHSARNKCAYATPRRACTEYCHALLTKGNASDIYSAKQCPNCDSGCPLNVIVEVHS